MKSAHLYREAPSRNLLRIICSNGATKTIGLIQIHVDITFFPDGEFARTFS
jgi:hypothetical protein